MPHRRSGEKIIERRARQGAKRKASREELPKLRRYGALNTVPFVITANIITRGRYLNLGRGFIVGQKIHEINKKEVCVNKLKEVRKAKGLSQLRLSFIAGIAPGDISRIESGWIKPYPGWKKRLSRALGVTEKELFAPEEKGESK